MIFLKQIEGIDYLISGIMIPIRIMNQLKNCWCSIFTRNSNADEGRPVEEDAEKVNEPDLVIPKRRSISERHPVPPLRIPSHTPPIDPSSPQNMNYII